jgi:hypothetical protein
VQLAVQLVVALLSWRSSDRKRSIFLSRSSPLFLAVQLASLRERRKASFTHPASFSLGYFLSSSKESATE